MNNKFIKRVAAVVLGVAVMSSCAFATTIGDATAYDKSSRVLTFAYEIEGEADKVSYIAYAGPTEETAETIVAVNQIDGATGVTETINISADLLGDANVIVLQTGDSAGSAVEETVLYVNDYVAETATAKSTEITSADGKFTYTNVPCFDVKVNIVKSGYTFKGFKQVDGTKTWDSSKIENMPTITGTGEIEINNVYFIGVPEEEVSGLKIEAWVEAN